MFLAWLNLHSLTVALCPIISRISRDAWAKHKDLDSYEAKWLYVDELLRVSTTCTLQGGMQLILMREGASEVF